MTGQRCSEEEIFAAALEKPTPEDRAVYLAAACGEDAALRASVEKLLDAHDNPVALLDLTALGAEPSVDDATSEEGPGAMIGHYKLRELIGEGGFGNVYLAEQEEPVRRRVALKIIKLGMDSREVVARFEAERQALALMDHPNIARVFDAGTTATGRPFFVMELVHGVPITQYCNARELSIRQRLELFIHVGNAVQHAHQKGVIHRDLKPPNVLVALHDGTPVVKVIDFGVAKAMGEPLTTKTIYTRSTQVLGTPLYMSPEQIELNGFDVDTRSDIYSLGVLLYEMLTGATPFDQERLHSVSFDELRRMIREEDPPRPSARLTTLQQCGVTVATERESSERGSSKQTSPVALRGDLDWVVMKALEKDRTRRYETAAALVADVRRYLDHEPITARPPSPVYRFSKFARRNKVFITTASLVAAALVAGTAVSTWQAVLATRARAEADTLRQEAVDFAENLKQANILLDNARANADGGRWMTAFQQYTKAGELQPDHYPVWSGRASLLVRLGLWKRAAADFARAWDLGAPANHPGWWGVPQVFLYTGDLAAYHAVVARMLQQCETSTDSVFKLIAMRGCLVSPQPDADPRELAKRAESLLRESPRGPFRPGQFGHGPPGPRPNKPPNPEPKLSPRRAPGPPPGPEVGPPPGPGAPRELYCYVAGLACYRAGNMEKAIQYLQESMQPARSWRAQAMAYPVLAMAYQRTGRVDKAEETLAEAEKTLGQWLNTMREESFEPMPVPWLDFVEYLLLKQEAKLLVTGKVSAEDPRMTSLRERALQVIGAQ